jgi:hypothetical protein
VGGLSSNAKKVIVQVVPRKAPIKNFRDDDPRLPMVQAGVLGKLEKQVKKLVSKAIRKKGQKPCSLT